jgi:UDP-apiose/xylose synthase
MADRRVIILGCGGFVGSHLTERLLADGRFEITGFDVSDSKCSHLLDNPNFNFTKGYVDASNTDEVLRPVMDGAEAIFSLAAVCNPAEYVKNPVFTINSNFIHAYKLVDLCTEAGAWIIHTSTCEVYGRTIASYLPDNDYSNPDLYEQREDETPLVMGPTVNQRWTYAASKALFERYIYANHTENGLPFTIVRPYNWFGPRMDYIPGRDGDGVPRVLACFMRALLDKQPIQLVDGGSAYRTITYIEDSVDALTAMLEVPKKAKNTFFNIGNRANEITMRDLAHLMCDVYADITGDDSYRNHPIEDIAGEKFYGPGYEDCDRRVPDVSRAERLLGWKAQVPLRDTLFHTMSYFHELYGKK